MNKERFQQLRQQFSAPAENYEIMNGAHQRVNEAANVWDDDHVREKHLEYTDRLIGILDGSIPRDPEVYEYKDKELAKQVPDVVIALDKSARPVMDMVDAFWEQLADKDAKKPETDFLNIDRISWLRKMGYSKADADSSATKMLDFDVIPSDDIARIRAYFTEGELSEDNWQDEVWKLPTRLDGKKIMVLDEMKNSGATIRIAVELIRRAIPESAVVTGEIFWQDTSIRMVGGESQGMTGPLWYDRNSEAGRGVGDVNVSYYDQKYAAEPTQENLRKKIAGFVLSTPYMDEHFTPLKDHLYDALKQDIAFMTYDYANGHVYRRTDLDREDWDEVLKTESAKMDDVQYSQDDMIKYGAERSRQMADLTHRRTNTKARR